MNSNLESRFSKYSGHLKNSGSLVSFDGDFSAQFWKIRPIFLCFTNRCGSNFFAESLASSGKFNLGKEVYNFESIKNAISVNSQITNYQNYLQSVVINDARSGYFVSKLAVAHIPILLKCGLGRWMSDFGIFIHIQRSDKLRQAISLHIANETNAWTSLQKSEEDVRIEFDRDEIEKNILNIQEQNSLFELFFAENGIESFAVNYEQFSFMPRHVLNFIGNQIGEEIILKTENLRLAKQSSRLNENLRDLYVSID